MNDQTKQQGEPSPLKRAYLAIEKLEQRVASLSARDREPIAIVGIGCRLPGGVEDPAGFAALLHEGRDALHEAPPHPRPSYRRVREDVTPPMTMPPAGFLSCDVAAFDPQFFSIAPREAVGMDPQQRLLLEVAWEALEDAAESPTDLYESKTGVFVGVCGNDYAHLLLGTHDTEVLDAHLTSGIGHSVVSGRLSYLLGLQGPSLSIDTACSSSLVATHLACRSLRSRETDLALACGVNLILDSDLTVAFTRSGMLSPDGRCRTFADDANGFARAEGCGVVVLKRLTDAIADGNRIYAVIRGTAVNQDGPSSALSAPNGPAQEAVIRAALRDAELAPSDVDVVEAHGTATPLGDPIEVRALAAVFGEQRPADQPLLIGSVKTNVGHLESTAGVAGLIKAALSLDGEFVPAHLHWSTPSRHIPWQEIDVAVADQRRSWPRGVRVRRIGVSSFGYSGTNCHVVLEEAPAPKPRQAQPNVSLPHLLTLSAASAPALKELAQRYARYLPELAQSDLADACFTSNVGRAHLAHRLAVIGRDDLAARVGAWTREGWSAGAATGRTPVEPPRVAFAFTGQGSQYPGMARRLYEVSPVFRDALDTCSEPFERETGEKLLSVLHGDRAHLLAETRFAQPALFAVEWALAHWLMQLGVRPAAVFGHSLGEYVAACVAGVFTVADGIRLVARRGRLMHDATAEGAMLAVAIDEASAAAALLAVEGASIAAVNGPSAVVLAGTVPAIAELEKRFAEQNLRSHRLDVARAFHSPLMEPILGDFEAEVRNVELRRPRLRLLSAVTGRALSAEQAVDPAYWRLHVRAPVLFGAAAAAFAEQPGIVIEIGPHRVLSTFPREGKAAELAWTPTLRRDADDWESMLLAVQALYAAGLDVDFKSLHRGRALRRGSLPRYPFQRQQYWAPAISAQRAEKIAADDAGHPLLGKRLDAPIDDRVFQASITLGRFSFVADHKVAGVAIMPAAGFLEAAEAAARAMLRADAEVRDFEVIRAMPVGAARGAVMHTVVTPNGRSGAIRLHSRDSLGDAGWTLHAQGRYAPAEPASAGAHADLDGIRGRCSRVVTGEEFYAGFKLRGLEFGSALLGMRKAWVGSAEALAEVELPEHLRAEAALYGLHPALLDACLQAVGLAVPPEISGDALFLPVYVGRFAAERGLRRCLVHARVVLTHDGMLTADVTAYADGGKPVVRLEGLRFKRATQAILQQLSGRSSEPRAYEIAWHPASLHAKLEETLRPWIAELPATLAQREAEHDAADYERFFGAFEDLCADYFVAALAELGWHPQSAPRTSDQLAEQLRIVPEHRRLFGRLLEIAAETGYLRSMEGKWLAGQRPLPSDMEQRLAALAARHPSAHAEIGLVARCGPAMARALLGKCDPLELLFPRGDLATAEQLYRESTLAKVFNSTVADAVEHLAKSGRRLRILEIGAGTGGTTSHVLDRVGDAVDYTFTDVSGLFTARARERFAKYGNVLYKELDIEHDPLAQGFREHSYDLIVASNVLHATADMRATLRRVRGLLAPGGVLIALEVFAPHRWFDLTVGLTSGWWKFVDADLRTAYPTLTCEQWTALLEETGFTAPHALPGAREGDGVFTRQGVVLGFAPATAAQQDEAWLILGDRGGQGRRLAERLSSMGALCEEVAADALYAGCADGASRAAALTRTLRNAGGRAWAGVVHLYALDAAAAREGAVSDGLDVQVEGACASVLQLAQACAALEPGAAPRVFVVTRGAQPVLGDESYLQPAQATIWGLARTVDLEHPTLPFVRIDLDPSNPYDQTEALASCLQSANEERQIALRDGQTWVPRLQLAVPPAEVAASNDSPYRLVCSERGSFDALKFEPSGRMQPGAMDVEICVEATALNFKDVLNVLGLYPGDPGALGSECAGVVTRVGADVRSVAPGDRVMAFVGAAFDRYVRVSAAHVARVPSGMTSTSAATIPVAFLTAAYALLHCARIASGDRVLIHAAAGGVGMAALQLARAAGATIYATAGTDEKRAMLRSLGVPHIYDSRDLSFADAVLADTGGAGVDVVLNSLADGFVERSFAAIARGGRFLEIGKRGIWSAEQVAALNKGIDYHVIDWGVTAREQPELIAGLFREIVERFARLELRPLPVRVFARARLADAFRYMAAGRHTGKIVVAHSPAENRPSGVAAIDANGTYLITGGLSGIGLLAARWLAQKGARHLALIGRRGATPEAADVLAQFERQGVRVTVAALDVADRASLDAFLQRLRREGPPLRGVIQSAGVLDDGVLLKQSWERFRTVFAPKVVGTSHLHGLTLGDPLDFFVLFSSMAGMTGSAGQANHAAANVFMDVLAAERRRSGRPALSVGWGPWAEAGAAVRHGVIERGAARGLRAMSPEDAFAALEVWMATQVPHVGVADIDWSAHLADLQPTPAYFEALHSEQPSDQSIMTADDGGPSDWAEELASLPLVRQRSEVLRIVRTQVIRLLGLPGSDIETDRPLSEMGLDSLLAVEIRNVLGKSFGLTLPATVTFDHPSIEALAAYLHAQRFGQDEAPPADRAVSSESPLDQIEALSEEDLDRLIAAKLQGSVTE